MEYETAYRQHWDGLMFASDLPRPSPACLCTPTELLTEGATSEIADVGDVSHIETDMPELENDKEEDLPEFPPPLYQLGALLLPAHLSLSSTLLSLHGPKLLAWSPVSLQGHTLRT